MSVLLNGKFDDLTKLIFSSAISFKDDFKKERSERDNRIAYIKKTYKENTPEYRSEIETAQQKEKSHLDNLRMEYSKNILELAEEIKTSERKALSVVNTDNLSKIHAFSEMTLSQTEMQALKEAICDNDYWSSRVLSEIAEKNGITDETIGIDPPFDRKMAILSECLNAFDKFIMNYTPVTGRMKTSDELRLHVGVSADVLDRAAALYAGKGESYLTDADIISKSLATLLTKHTDVEKAVTISNILQNVKNNELVKNKLLYEISMDSNISDAAIRMSGFYDEVGAFKNGLARDYKKAEFAIEEVRKAKDNKKAVDMRISENMENIFFVDMIRVESKKNNTVYEAWREHLDKESETER